MMKNVTRNFLLICSSLLLLSCTTTNIGAQEKNPKPRPKDKVIIFPSDAIRVPPGGLSVIPPYSVRGKIRWRKEYGIVPSGPATGEPAFLPCGQHFVAAMKTTGQPGSFGRLTTVASTPDIPNIIIKGPDEGGYYVCNYIIPDLPRDTSLLILAGMGGTLLLPEVDRAPYYHTSPWIGGSQPQPPSGHTRVFTGDRSVTLTGAAPRAVVDFEMVYKPMQQGPR
ncbi:MAG: hypothetical protein H0U54_10480 [Acidobacteria bacterium]|nr:hypothetical protein [Acidobacteriota bacterium]